MNLKFSDNILNNFRSSTCPICRSSCSTTQRIHIDFTQRTEGAKREKTKSKWRISANKFNIKKACTKLGTKLGKIVQPSRKNQNSPNRSDSLPNNNANSSIETRTVAETRNWNWNNDRRNAIHTVSFLDIVKISLIFILMAIACFPVMIVIRFRGYFLNANEEHSKKNHNSTSNGRNNQNSNKQRNLLKRWMTNSTKEKQ